MSITAEMFSSRARSGLADYFPTPDASIRYNFDQGVPAPEIYPYDDMKKYASQVVDTDGIACCEYFAGHAFSEMSYGFVGLRQQIADRVSARDGRPTSADEIMLVNGSSQGLALVAAAFVGPGDGVIIEASTFPYMTGYLESTGATVATVPVDAEGLAVDALPAKLAELAAGGTRPKLIYCIPSFQVPTGSLMGLERRRQLLQIAQEWDLVIVEDNCYHELYYDAPPPPTLRALDTDGRVIQSDSFSKILAPGLRMGWVVGPSVAMTGLAAVRQDLGVSQWIAHTLERYLADGNLDPHLASVRELYRHKRDVALEALQAHCTGYASWNTPAGGIYFWLRLADGLDADLVKVLLANEGVACRPGERFTGDTSGAGFLRLAFLHVPEDEIRRGIAALGTALDKATLS